MASRGKKPSISIDLPGWCTLREVRDDVDGHETSHGAWKDISNNGGRSSIGDIRRPVDILKAGSDDESDDDGAIARLFSLGSKRKRKDSDLEYPDIMASDPGLMAAAYLDWACVRCTFVNTYDQRVCQGCGGQNVKRQRRLREQRKEEEFLEQMKSARERRDRSRKEALKDVLEDSDSEQEGVPPANCCPNSDQGRHDATAKSCDSPQCKEAPGDDSEMEGNVPKAVKDPAMISEAQEAGSTVSRRQDKCFISVLPPDLLLQCAEFLDDTRTLCRVCEVSHGWLVTLDGLEAGRRLWRPVFYRLRANGDIHAATDSRGQPRRQLKVYDLGSSAGQSCADSPGFAEAQGASLMPSVARTPVLPSLASRARQSEIEGLHSASGGTPGSDVASATGTPRRSSACSVCGLIQREGYIGRDCEMCASSLVLTPSRASLNIPRVAYTRVNLSESAASATKSARIAPMDIPGSVDKSGRGTSTANIVGGIRKTNGSDGGRDDEEETDDESDIDWHFLVKRLAEEKRIVSGWGTLHYGWVWLQGALQSMLRRRTGDESTTPNSSGKEYLSSRDPGRGIGTCPGSDKVETRSLAPGRGGESTGDLDATIARVVRKLTSKKWVLLYDSIKATFALQAQGLARAVIYTADAAKTEGAVSRSTAADAYHDRARRGTGLVKVTGDGLEGIRACIAAWEAFKDWCEEVDVYCELLNEQISAERYRTAGAGCGRGDNTPFIRDAALLSFRHSFALNVQICSMLRTAIAEGMLALQLKPPASRGAHPDAISEEAATPCVPRSEGVSVDCLGALGMENTDADELFTDMELVEDPRAVDFSVRSYSGSCSRSFNVRRPCTIRGGRAAGNADTESNSWPSSVHKGALQGTSSGACSGGSKQGHYYDWFLSKLEGQEMSIIRGDVDARGKKLGARTLGAKGAAGGASDSANGAASALQATSLDGLLDLLRDMIEELDVPDDTLSKDRHTQGAMRRLLLLPIKRWQAATFEAETEDPQNLLMAGLSPAPGKEGLHRLRSGAAVRRRGKLPVSALGKDASKSWEKLSSFFG